MAFTDAVGSVGESRCPMTGDVLGVGASSGFSFHTRLTDGLTSSDGNCNSVVIDRRVMTGWRTLVME